MAKIFCDSNILVGALWPESQTHQLCQQLLTSYSLIISHQVILETSNVLSSPALKSLQPPEAEIATQQLLQSPHITLVCPKTNTLQIWHELFRRYKLGRQHFFDTYIVATMLSNNISKITTFNTKHFDFFKEIQVLSPESFFA